MKASWETVNIGWSFMDKLFILVLVGQHKLDVFSHKRSSKKLPLGTLSSRIMSCFVGSLLQRIYFWFLHTHVLQIFNSAAFTKSRLAKVQTLHCTNWGFSAHGINPAHRFPLCRHMGILEKCYAGLFPFRVTEEPPTLTSGTKPQLVFVICEQTQFAWGFLFLMKVWRVWLKAGHQASQIRSKSVKMTCFHWLQERTSVGSGFLFVHLRTGLESWNRQGGII